MIEINGETKKAGEWSESVNKRVSRQTIQQRWNRGVRGKELLLPPAPPKPRNKPKWGG